MSNVLFSFDFECGWGAIDNGLWVRREQAGVYRTLRFYLQQFINHMDDCELSATWAVVGALIDPPERRDITHLEGAYRNAVDTFLSNSDEQTRDGRDLLDILMCARTPQKFGTHSYSHVRFTDLEQSPAVYEAELNRARTANERAGISSDCLVFPRNEHGHLDVVARAGLTRVRTAPRFQGAKVSKGRVARAWLALSAPPSPVSETRCNNGLILHSGTEFLNWGFGAGALKRTIVRRRIDAALRFAENGHGDVHFWIHPFNLVETEGLFDYVVDVMTRVARLRDAGRLSVATF